MAVALHLSIDGTTVMPIATQARMLDRMTIHAYKGGQRDTCAFVIDRSSIAEGQEVLVGLGGLTAADLVFGGIAQRVRKGFSRQTDGRVVAEVECGSFALLLNRRKVNAKYTATDADDIVDDLLTNFSDGFTWTGLEASLPTIDEIQFTNEDLSDCLDRICKLIGGDWVLGYDKDITLGLDIFSGDAASDITDVSDPGARQIVLERDLSEVRTRILVEGGGSTCGAQVTAGESILPVIDAVWYSDSGGDVASGPQRITYASKVSGLGSAQVGTSIAPGAAPNVAAAAGSGVTSGTHSYKYTFVTGAGESLPSSASSIVTAGNQISAPSSAPSGAKAFGGNLSSGVYSWKVTYYDSAGGETTPSSASSNVTMDDIAAPTGIPTAAAEAGGSIPNGATYGYAYTFSNGTVETTKKVVGTGMQINVDGWFWKFQKSMLTSPPSGFHVQWYRTVDGGSTYKRMNGSANGMSSEDATWYYDLGESDGSLGPDAPSSSTAIYRQATVTIPVSSDPATVGRKLYRTTAGGGTWKLVATVANNTATSYGDNIADGSLGASAPGSNTATLSRVAVTGITAGPTGTTSRKLYRTVAGNTGNYKLVATIADNSTTSYTDSTADGSLGADAPSSDTSGLVQETGNVNAGATSLAVTATTPFQSSGGWAYVGRLAIRYTGTSASALTGVPASGIGSIPGSLRYGQTIVAAPMLTGIATSGDGSIQYDIPDGDPVNVVATADDAAAQAVMAALVGGDGIHEEYMRDGRLSLSEAQARAEAKLTEVKDPLETVTYLTRDDTTRAGKTVTIDLTSPITIDDTYRIQSTELTLIPLNTGDVIPEWHVQASSRRYAFEQLLRQLKAAA